MICRYDPFVGFFRLGGNANLMILLSYIIIGHRDWKGAVIKIFAISPESTLEEEREKLLDLINEGKLPISPNNISFLSQRDAADPKSIINKKSRDADLTIMGFRQEMINHFGEEIFKGYDDIGNCLFITASAKKIK